MRVNLTLGGPHSVVLRAKVALPAERPTCCFRRCPEARFRAAAEEVGGCRRCEFSWSSSLGSQSVAIMSNRNNNKLPSNLPQLQNLIKRDPPAYVEEVGERRGHASGPGGTGSDPGGEEAWSGAGIPACRVFYSWIQGPSRGEKGLRKGRASGFIPYRLEICCRFGFYACSLDPAATKTPLKTSFCFRVYLPTS